MKSVNILSICGSGTVTNSVVAAKLKDHLSEHDYQVSATETEPTRALSLTQSECFDIIVHASPLSRGDYGIPYVSTFVYITGIGEGKFFEDFLKALQLIEEQAFNFAVHSMNYKREINIWLYQNF